MNQPKINLRKPRIAPANPPPKLRKSTAPEKELRVVNANQIKTRKPVTAAPLQPANKP